MSGNWDGTERRRNEHDRMFEFEQMVKLLTARFDSEFGNNKTTGNVYRNLIGIKDEMTRLAEAVKTQNGSINRLKDWNSKFQGAMAVILILIIPIILQVVNKWINGN